MPQTPARFRSIHSRMRRWISTVLLGLAVFLVVIWAFSFFREIYVAQQTLLDMKEGTLTPYQHALSAERGRWWLAYVRADPDGEPGPNPPYHRWYYGHHAPDWSAMPYHAPRWLWRLGVDWRGARFNRRADGTYMYQDAMVAVPQWLVILLAAGAGWFVDRRGRLGRQRLRRGLCPACGYDLRASPDFCPECGHMVDAGQRPSPARASA